MMVNYSTEMDDFLAAGAASSCALGLRNLVQSDPFALDVQLARELQVVTA